ncbi:integrin alpha-V-like isoform X1 [Corticium candelabrum]|uniref:integrin alpha-V-like isoform X1 n=1 Tax=Corticium candelabrum TaxID=121492 RepID=UPI002E26BA4E|nr:integrin alpha-V-like isoform X1 [Corticium candelabrum]
MAYLLRGCSKALICIPDLHIGLVKVKVSGKDGNVILRGEANEMTVFVTVTNKEENAYNARLIVTFLSDLRYIGLDKDTLFSCDASKDSIGQNRIICPLGNPFQSKDSVTFGIKINVQSLSADIQDFKVSLEAKSDNPENATTLIDNYYETESIIVETKAAYGFNDGRPSTAQIEFDIDKPTVDVSREPTNQREIGQFVNHTYSVINKGPSVVNFVNLDILWPWKVKKGNSTYLLYITDLKMPSSTQCNTGDIENPLKLEAPVVEESNATTVEGEIVTRTKRSIRSLRASSEQLCPEEKDCPGSSNALCCPIKCRISQLQKGGTADIEIVSRLYERSLVQGKISALNVTSFANVSAEIENYVNGDPLPKSINVTTQITQPAEVTDESLEVWIIIVVVIVTVLILIAAVILLAYLGFFKRAKKEQLNKEKAELAAHGEQLLKVSNGD